MNYWVCPQCGLVQDIDDDRARPLCWDCGCKMVRRDPVTGQQLPEGFRPCDLRPNPFITQKTSKKR